MDKHSLSRREFLKLGLSIAGTLSGFKIPAIVKGQGIDPSGGVSIYLPMAGNNHRPPPFKFDRYPLYKLSDEDLPYALANPLPLDYEYPHDDDGVLIFTYKDGVYYHPVSISQLTIRFLESYRLTENPEYWCKAELHLDKLAEISTMSDDARYFPYGFDFPLHGIQTETMFAPWYSGMAQGQALSAFVRAYKLSGANLYLSISEEIFRSFTHFMGEHHPWIVFIDDGSYYWIEEYPWLERTQALNGFIFAIYGIYDYYFLTDDPLAFMLTQAAITTIREYITAYRNPGGISFYCLRHKEKISTYHIIHTNQLKMLYKFTQAQYFNEMADVFYSDYH